VIWELTKKVGFSFSERELSPELRRRIGELESLDVQLDAMRADASRTKVEQSNNRAAAVGLGVVGVLFLFFLLVTASILVISVP